MQYVTLTNTPILLCVANISKTISNQGRRFLGPKCYYFRFVFFVFVLGERPLACRFRSTPSTLACSFLRASSSSFFKLIWLARDAKRVVTLRAVASYVYLKHAPYTLLPSNANVRVLYHTRYIPGMYVYYCLYSVYRYYRKQSLIYDRLTNLQFVYVRSLLRSAVGVPLRSYQSI